MIARLLAVASVLLIVSKATSPRAESPRNLYTLNCWGCHRANGEGVVGTAPPLTNAADFLKVPGGREYLIRVPGVSQSMLNDADAAEVMNWIIVTFSKERVPADFQPFTAAEIRHARAQPHLFNVSETRTQLLKRMVAMKIRPPQRSSEMTSPPGG